MNYTAINIGPIIKTLSLARRPRELWSASYMFSYLMECIIAKVSQKKCTIIAPITGEKPDISVGLYPDRLYFSHDNNTSLDVEQILSDAWGEFQKNVFGQNINCRDYFNLMHVTLQFEEQSHSVILAKLNDYLDLLELCAFAVNPQDGKDPLENIYGLIAKRKESPLVEISTGNTNMHMETLAEIAAAQLAGLAGDKWDVFVKNNRDENYTDDPYSVFKSLTEYKSYHRYFCVVQADGDNMGKTVTSPNLSNDQLTNVSKGLWDYGKEASRLINDFGGKAIYAGGDDLLFIAPLVGKDGNSIFGLFEKIEEKFNSKIKDVVENMIEDKSDAPSLSFGVAMAYYKHPLYEVLESAINQLFGVAKGGSVKNKIAWRLEKHSGETFSACYSKLDKGLDDAFKNLIMQTEDANTVSAVAHKLKLNWTLLEKCLEADRENKGTKRLDSLFAKMLEASEGDSYFNAVKEVVLNLYPAKDITNLADVLYTMLRTAKFIKGEDTKDE